MHIRYRVILSTCALLLSIVVLGACQRARSTIAPAPTITQTPTASPVAITETSTPPQPYPPVTTPAGIPTSPVPYVPPVSQVPSPRFVTLTPTLSSPSPTFAVSTGQVKTPLALTASVSPTTPASTKAVATQSPTRVVSSSPTQHYPAPVFTSTSAAYPGPVTGTPQLTRTPRRSVTPPATARGSVSPFPSQFPSPTPRGGTPGASPTELPPRPPLSPPPPGSTVTIWHSWNTAETDILQLVIESFKQIYPDVTFTLQFIPLDDLYDTYQEASYLGQGPSLLLGPAAWGPTLYDQQLVTDLTPFIPPNFLSKINPPALASGQYDNALVSLPLSQHGMVMYRNTQLIPAVPATFDALTSSAIAATHAGKVGSYLERGSQFSAAAIIGLGGRLMDTHGYPAFNDSYGLEWFSLLADYHQAGAVTFNTNYDLEMFKRGRVGIIIDGTWNISLLSQAIGATNLAIDPWPTYGTGHMSGWVQADSVILNANTTGDNQFAALSFIGYLLEPDVQARLAEIGHIPSVTSAVPRDALIQQALVAFSNAAPYPVAVEDSLVQLYQSELDKAIYSVFSKGVSPSEALLAASNAITTQLNNPTSTPQGIK